MQVYRKQSVGWFEPKPGRIASCTTPVYSSQNIDFNLITIFTDLLDLFKSLVVLWIVNTVNELIHLSHIIHQNPLYVGLPICFKTWNQFYMNCRNTRSLPSNNRNSLLQWLFNPNLTRGLVGKVQQKKNYLPKEEGREGGEKKRAQHAHRARCSNLGPTAC